MHPDNMRRSPIPVRDQQVAIKLAIKYTRANLMCLPSGADVKRAAYEQELTELEGRLKGLQ